MASAIQYFDLQAKSAAAMEASLDEAEKLGFTYGINPNSRHVMLRGWREQLANVQKDVPVAEIPPEKPAPPKAPAKSNATPPKPAETPPEKAPGQ